MTEDRLSDDEPQSSVYGRRVGERLRSIRRQKRLSLQDVEANSAQEFKASVLGAYERGERAISVPRLQRLARFYNVPVDQLLPADEGPDFDGAEIIDLTDRRAERPVEKLAIDLTRLEEIRGPDAEMLGRYLAMIQVQRQDFNGRVLTVRTRTTCARSRASWTSRPTRPPVVSRIWAYGCLDPERAFERRAIRRLRPHPLLRQTLRLLPRSRHGPTAAISSTNTSRRASPISIARSPLASRPRRAFSSAGARRRCWRATRSSRSSITFPERATPRSPSSATRTPSHPSSSRATGEEGSTG